MRRPALLLLAGLAAAVLGGCGHAAPPVGCHVADGAGPQAHELDLDLEQAQVASTVAAVGRREGMPDHAVTVALATAMQESKLRNLPYGDRDSLGVFQQRPSQGWGTAQQVQDVAYASASFYAHLRLVPGWRTLSVSVAAQAVQHSGAGEAYAQHEAAARLLARALTGELPAGLRCQGTDRSTALRDGPLQAQAAVELGPGALHAAGANQARVWTSASWLVAHAQTYGVTAVTAGGRRWTAASGLWGPNPTAEPGVHYR